MVDQSRASWNQVAGWMRLLERLKNACDFWPNIASDSTDV